jgi:multidrug transporter EmrE-like cation transporter
MLLLMWIVYVVTDVYGHIALKLASGQQGLWNIVTSFWGISAGISWIITIGAWTFVLSKSPLLNAYTTSAITYVLISLATVVLFKESLTPEKIAGVVLVIIGIALVNR